MKDCPIHHPLTAARNGCTPDVVDELFDAVSGGTAALRQQSLAREHALCRVTDSADARSSQSLAAGIKGEPTFCYARENLSWHADYC